MSAIPALTNAQLNKRIISVVVFTFFCYLSIGLPLAVLPGYVHNQLGYSSFVAGLIISLQYFATLISRPQAGRYADLLGPKKVVLAGLVLCGASGVLSILAVVFNTSPLVSLLLLAAGRVVLGFGESLTATGSILWGINVVGTVQSARVISWNGVATYLAMAMGAPLGVMLNSLFGIPGFAGLIVVMAILGFWMATRRPAVKVQVGERTPFSQVFGKIWIYGLCLGLGTVGFGTIATFITLYFSHHGWSGAAFSLTLFSCGFILMRLLFNNSISRFGAMRVSLVSFTIECVGLLIIWQASSVWMVDLGAFLTGSGFSLIFPALGVEAIRRVRPQNQGSALGLYSAFLDCGLGVTGPLAGLLIGHWGIDTIYLAAAGVVLIALALIVRMLMQGDRRSPPINQ
ncbi:MFS transporter [Erwinia sp. JUb26]|uniref:MFS transporter n=1 Tax=Erwinia sp. JUb26 TaxID=2485126 RepID=UPI000F4AA404|nr:MFS transporter [Erwinia sp. JUb26]ROR11132.1 putative MFS family arabinose efflux permease [Erwinia sp. JUb26]